MDVTAILSRVGAGDREALEELFPLVYRQLRSLARLYMARERAGHTLQPTALTHEAYLRLVGGTELSWDCRAHFFAAAAQAMRRILVEHARARARKKRGGGWERVSWIDLPAFAPISRLDLLALDAALARLAAVDPRKERVVELLYFGGLTAAEAGEVLGVTSRTVERDWGYARLWLLREMEQGSCGAARGAAG